MLQIPPIPSWDSLHPLIIHFPIVLLLLAPIFVLVSALLPLPRGRPYMLVAISLLLGGTGSLFVAKLTGQAAAQSMQGSIEAKPALLLHQDLAAETLLVFVVLCVILLGMLVVARVLGEEESKLSSTYLPLAFLALYAVGVLLLVNTAHAGGQLTHGPAFRSGVVALETSPGSDEEPQVPNELLPAEDSAGLRSK